MNELQIVRNEDGFHIFDKRDGQTVGALVSRDHPTAESAVQWCVENYGVKASDFLPGRNTR